MANEQKFTLVFEASGEVTPAPKPAEDAHPETEDTEPETEEAEQ